MSETVTFVPLLAFWSILLGGGAWASGMAWGLADGAVTRRCGRWACVACTIGFVLVGSAFTVSCEQSENERRAAFLRTLEK